MLQNWIGEYVLKSEDASEDAKAKKPLSATPASTWSRTRGHRGSTRPWRICGRISNSTRWTSRCDWSRTSLNSDETDRRSNVTQTLPG